MGNKNILIVDDDSSIAVSLSEYLQKEGFCTVTAISAQEGLEKITEDTEIVITDIMMPQMNGIDFLRRLRECSPQVKTIMVTGYPGIDTLLKAKKYGAVDYLKKPYNPGDVKLLIERLTQNKKIEDEKKKLLLASQTLFNRLKDQLSTYQISLYSGKEDNLNQMLKKISEEAPDVILIEINNPLAPKLLERNKKKGREGYPIVIVADESEFDQIRDMLFAYGADDCILFGDSPNKIEQVIERCLEESKERVEQERQNLKNKPESVSRCLFAQVYHGGYYCLKKDRCGYKGNWVVIEGREYKKCLIRPFLVNDLSTIEFVNWEGEINGNNIFEFKEILMEPIRKGKKNIIINGAFLDKINFNIFELLYDAYYEMTKINQKGSINVINLDPRLLEQMEIFNLRKEIGFFGPRMLDERASFGKWDVRFD